jgi:hypothetical protein
MPSSNVRWPLPLNRLNPFYPGQMGVEGGWTETGLRQHCTGAIFYVDPNYPGTSDQRDGTDPNDPLTTVAAALTKCQAYRGDTIAVMANNAWQYGKAADGYATAIVEEVTVNVPGVRIVGVSPSGSLGPVWTPASNGGTCITVAAMDVLVEGFVFADGAFAGCDAISAEWDGVTLFGENLTVQNCVFDDSVDKAIILEYSWYCRIVNNIFYRCGEHAIYADAGGSGTAYSAIAGNWFHDCAVAVALLGGSDNNSIHANRIYGDGTGANNMVDLTAGADNIVTDNYLACTVAQYDTTCSDATSGAWLFNHCTNGEPVAPPT